MADKTNLTMLPPLKANTSEAKKSSTSRIGLDDFETATNDKGKH